MRPRLAPKPPLAVLRPSRSWGSQLPGPTENSESLPLARCREAEQAQAPRRSRRGPGLRGSGPHSLHDPARLCRPGSCLGSAAGLGRGGAENHTERKAKWELAATARFARWRPSPTLHFPAGSSPLRPHSPRPRPPRPPRPGSVFFSVSPPLPPSPFSLEAASVL
uniref:Uncharacterized protein n=1 Tax=Molossus molossus TaxID=27622 RepID=A0A7J8DT73_MOLMO|nr:hypothetical protein HJG59_009132 [Molossus molossus]